MLVIIACVLSQFQSAGKQPTMDEYRSTRIAQLRKELESQRPNKAELAKLPRIKAAAMVNAIDDGLASLDAAEKNKGYVKPGVLMMNTLAGGQIGNPWQEFSTQQTTRVGGRRIADINNVSRAAEFTVVQVLDSKTLICKCQGKEFVVRNYKGPAVADKAKFTADGIYIVSGTFRFPDGETLLAMEPWTHGKSWEALNKLAVPPAEKSPPKPKTPASTKKKPAA